MAGAMSVRAALAVTFLMAVSANVAVAQADISEHSGRNLAQKLPVKCPGQPGGGCGADQCCCPNDGCRVKIASDCKLTCADAQCEKLGRKTTWNIPGKRTITSHCHCISSCNQAGAGACRQLFGAGKKNPCAGLPAKFSKCCCSINPETTPKTNLEYGKTCPACDPSKNKGHWTRCTSP